MKLDWHLDRGINWAGRRKPRCSPGCMRSWVGGRYCDLGPGGGEGRTDRGQGVARKTTRMCSCIGRLHRLRVGHIISCTVQIIKMQAHAKSSGSIVWKSTGGPVVEHYWERTDMGGCRQQSLRQPVEEYQPAHRCKHPCHRRDQQQFSNNWPFILSTSRHWEISLLRSTKL